MKNRIFILAAIFLALSIGNYLRISSTSSVKPVHFLSIFLIGLFSGILLNQLLELQASRKRKK